MLLCDQLLLFLFEFKLDLLFCFPAGHYFDVFVAERDLIDLLTKEIYLKENFLGVEVIILT